MTGAGRRRAALRLIVLVLFGAFVAPAAALSLFGGHEVTVQFATPDGKPMANAEIRVFAPGAPNKAVATGRTDSSGKFVFDADRDGFWTAEARDASGEVARITVRVGATEPAQGSLSPFLLIGGLAALLGLALWYRVRRARARRPRS